LAHNPLIYLPKAPIFSKQKNLLLLHAKIIAGLIGDYTMSVALKQVIENIENLSSDEKALVAHCLISSLEVKHDDSVDQAWAELASQRFTELESGLIKGVSWSDIKNKITH
jgi:hypothetical protein